MLNLLAVTGTQISTYVILGVLIVAIIVMFVFSSKRRKKQEEDAKNLIDAVKPGNKVKTIGGICGIVVEIDTEENTFVLETGSEQSGKCFIKFDKQAIYQTDAVVEKAAPAADAENEPLDETPSDLKAELEDKEALTGEEKPVEEVKAEEPAKAEEKPAKKGKKN